MDRQQEFFANRSSVSTTVWLHNLDFNKTPRES